VMVDATRRKLDYLHWSLPGDMSAGTPEEVTTVVQLHYTEQEVGQYTGGGRALKVTCNVIVVDRASHVVLGSATFVGADPPQFTKTHAGEDDRGELPTKALFTSLKRLGGGGAGGGAAGPSGVGRGGEAGVGLFRSTSPNIKTPAGPSPSSPPARYSPTTSPTPAAVTPAA